jgi:hypothetical protein
MPTAISIGSGKILPEYPEWICVKFIWSPLDPVDNGQFGQWFNENINGEWFYDSWGCFFFEKEEDALMCYLRFKG